MNPVVQGFFDTYTSTVSYVVYEKPGTACAIIDAVLDYDPKSGRTQTRSADVVIDFVKQHDLQVQWILETHAHADHLSAAPYIKAQLGGKVTIGHRIVEVQAVFKKIFNLGSELDVTGRQFDRMLNDDEVFFIGALQARAIPVPGHTPACMAYQIGDAVFTGDTLFMPDVGTARCDFPGGDARQLFRSIRKLLALAPQTRLFMCHDYAPDSREVNWETTVAQQRACNIHVHDGVSEEDFILMRTQRDATLDMPTLILPAVQVNVRAGRLPPPEENGISYLKIPVNLL